MKAIISIVTLFCAVLFAHAQVLPDGMSITESAQFELPKGTDFNGIIGEIENGYIGFGYNVESQEVRLMQFAKDLSLTKKTTVKLASKDKDIRFQQVAIIQNVVYVFYSAYDEKSHVTRMLHVKTPIDSFMPSDPNEFFKFENSNLKERASFRTLLSKDGSHFGVMTSYTTGVDERQKLMHFDFASFDADLELEWENKETGLASEGEIAAPLKVLYANDGTFYFTLMTIEINQETIDDLMDYFKHYMVRVSSENAPDVREIELEDKMVNELTFAVMDNGDVNFLSFYYDKENEKNGYYFAMLQADNFSLLREKYSDFGYPNGIVLPSSPSSNEFLQRVVSMYIRVDPSLDFMEYYATEAGFYLVAEVSFQAYGLSDNGNYLGTMVAKFTDEGELLWELGIPKIQVSKSIAQYGSIGVFRHRGNIGILTNHLPGKENGTNLENGVWATKKSTSVYVTMVDDGGDYRTTELLNTKAPFYCPKYNYDNTDGNVIIIGNKGTDYGFLNIELE